MTFLPAIQRARAWLFDVTAHNHAEQLRIQRAVQRKKLGIVDQQDYPYPGASINSTTNSTSLGGWVSGMLVGASLLLGGGGAYMGLRAAGLGSSPVPLPTVIQTVPAPVQTVPIIQQSKQLDSNWREERVEVQPDGSEKVVGTIHFRSRSGVVEMMQPDGSWVAVPGAVAPGTNPKP